LKVTETPVGGGVGVLRERASCNATQWKCGVVDSDPPKAPTGLPALGETRGNMGLIIHVAFIHENAVQAPTKVQ